MVSIFNRQQRQTLESQAEAVRQSIKRPSAASTAAARTHRELRDYYIKESKRYEDAATHRKMQIKLQIIDEVVRDLTNSGRVVSDLMFGVEVDMRTDKAAEKDPVWRGKVAMNQWMISQATMYGIAALDDTRIR